MIEAGAIAFVSASANYAIGQGFNINGANVSPGTRIGNVLAHAALGCAMAEAGGGKCGAGVLSGAVTAGMDQIDTGSFGGGYAMAMVAGCAGSAAGGGSCSRGAASSALIYLYNKCASGGAGNHSRSVCLGRMAMRRVIGWRKVLRASHLQIQLLGLY